MSRPPFPVPPGGPGLAPPPGYFVPRPPMPAPFPMQPYPPGAPVPMVGVPPMGQAPPRPMYPGAPMPGPPMTPGGVPPRNPGRQRTYPGPRAPRTPPPSMSMVHRSTSVYVGKIANSVDDGVMQSLLEACGGVKSWKRQEDPETKQPKGFGFCEFEDAEGVLRALRLLNNLALDGQELLVKCNTATQKYIEAYESEKEAREAEKQEEKEEGEAPGNADEDRDNEVLEKIMAIVSDREDKIKKHKADQERAAEVLNALAVAKPDSATGSRDREDRERNDHRGRSKERTMEREFDRKRQQERREQEAKQREEDRAYDKKLQEWDRQERRKAKDKERERERLKDLERERVRQLKADLEASESDDEVEPWARRSIRSSRRAEERRRKRREEEIRDAEDRERELEELEAKRLRQTEESEDEGEPWQPSDAVAAPADDGPGLAATGGEGGASGNGVAVGPAVDPNDPIYQAMVAAALSAPRRPSPVVSLPDNNSSPGPSTTPPNPYPPSQQPTYPAQVNALAGVFGVDDEEDKPERQLRPIQYTEEEARVAKEGNLVDDPKVAMKRLMDSIPTSKEGVFSYPIKWDAYESATLGPNISRWVSKKIQELLGVEEPTLVTFIMNKLEEHLAPRNLMEELGMVFDEEAETFVLKLYRMVIYETEKSALGF